MADPILTPIPNGFPPETPWWARLAIVYGVPFLLVMYLLGMFDGLPGLKSPITRLTDGLAVATSSQVNEIRAQTDALRSLKSAIDDDRMTSANDRKTMINELAGMRSDLYATRTKGPSTR